MRQAVLCGEAVRVFGQGGSNLLLVLKTTPGFSKRESHSVETNLDEDFGPRWSGNIALVAQRLLFVLGQWSDTPAYGWPYRPSFSCQRTVRRNQINSEKFRIGTGKVSLLVLSDLK